MISATPPSGSENPVEYSAMWLDTKSLLFSLVWADTIIVTDEKQIICC